MLLNMRIRRSATILLVALASCRRTDKSTTMTINPSAARPAQSTTVSAPVPAALRVVTLGDSLAYGAGDESGKGLAGRLRSELRDRGVSDVTTVNLGVNGAQTGDLMSRLKTERVRSAVSEADAIVLSIGANDLFRTPGARDRTLENPLAVADQILDRIESIVAQLRAMNPDARILILGGYNPVPKHPLAPLINQYLGIWDETLAERFAKDPRVSIVKMSDIVVPQRLSRLDSFHPGGAAYEAAAKRIAGMLV
jgi:lysophospholipase L1-like esterase